MPAKKSVIITGVALEAVRRFEGQAAALRRQHQELDWMLEALHAEMWRVVQGALPEDLLTGAGGLVGLDTSRLDEHGLVFLDYAEEDADGDGGGEDDGTEGEDIAGGDAGGTAACLPRGVTCH